MRLCMGLGYRLLRGPGVRGTAVGRLEVLGCLGKCCEFSVSLDLVAILILWNLIERGVDGETRKGILELSLESKCLNQLRLYHFSKRNYAR